MTVADRIALIADGRLVESGTPAEIYEAPRKRFTADFVGENNILDGAVRDVGEEAVALKIGNETLTVARGTAVVEAGQPAAISIRSELIELAPDEAQVPDGFEHLAATYREQVYLGLTTSHIVALSDGREINVRAISGGDSASAQFDVGQPVRIVWDRSSARLHTE